jgi:hypothetical protein
MVMREESSLTVPPSSERRKPRGVQALRGAQITANRLRVGPVSGEEGPMRFLSLVVVCALVACGSRDADVQHDEAIEFGNVAVCESSTATLRVRNTGGKPAQLTLGVEAGDFTIDESALTVPADSEAAVTVHFTPSALGPRAATLTIGDATVALVGRGVGPQLSVPRELTLGPLVIVTGKPVDVLATTITLRNTGTSGSLLRVGAPRVEGTSELCVGTISGSTCVAWEPPALLDARTLLEVPLSILPSSEGTKRWTVIFPSNDPLNPEVRLELLARVDAFAPCEFVAPGDFVLRDTGVLRVRHVGPGTCLVQNVLVSPSSAVQLTVPRLPLHLASNHSLDVELAVRGAGLGDFPGFVRVVAAGTDPLDVGFQRRGPPGPCLVVTPSTVDFGTVPMACNSPQRTFQIYNACGDPAVIDSIILSAPAGETPGGPNCPGSAACPEFFMVSSPPSGTTVFSGGPPVTFTVKYRPINYGPDTGAVVINTRDGLNFVIALQGRGDQYPRQTDTYRTDTLPIVDVLVMVDPSPSFVSRRESVRDNLLPLLNRLGNGCFDARFAFAPADGALDAGVRLQPNDAGASWSSSREPDFVARSLSAFDSLPVGSELEACVGPAADLIDDAGVRDGGVLSALCVTDALESSVDATGALQRLQRHARTTSWSSVAGYGAGCAVEALDDGVHYALVSAGNGIREDICNPSWGQSFVGFGSVCSYRTSFYLSARPAGPIEVRVDGVLSPQSDWMYDPTNNAVTFLPGSVPPPGATTTFSYDWASCSP